MVQTELLTERIYLRSPNIHVGMKAEIEGNISKEIFDQAIRNVCIKHAIVRSRINLQSDGRAFFLIDSDNRIRIRYIDDKDVSDWKQIYDEMDSEPFDFENGPLIRFSLIRDKERSVLLVLGHHLLGDGLSYTYLIRDIVSALNGELDTDEIFPSVMGVNTFFPTEKITNFLLKAVTKKLNRKWQQNPKLFSDSDFEDFFYDYRKRYGTDTFISHMDKNQTEKLISTCHKNGVTVNDALVTACMFAVLSEDRHRSNTEVGIAVNIRNLLKPAIGESMGNYASGMALSIFHNSRESFWYNVKQNSKAIKKRMRSIIKKNPALELLSLLDTGLTDSVSFSLFGNYHNEISDKIAEMVKVRRENKSIGVSDLGKFQFEQDRNRGFGLRNLIFLPPAFPANDITFGILTCNGQLNISVRYYTAKFDESRIATILNSAIGLLTEA